MNKYFALDPSLDHDILVAGSLPIVSQAFQGYCESTSPAFAKGLVAFARRTRGRDVIHLHAPTLTYWSIKQVLLCAIRGKRTILTSHLPSEPAVRPTRLGRIRSQLDFLVRGITLWLTRTQCFTPSEETAAIATARLHRLARFRCLLNGVHDVEPQSWNTDRTFRVVYAGRLAPHKQPVLFLAAVAEALRSGVDLKVDILGDGPLRSTLEERLAADETLEDAVVLHGHVADISRFLAKAHLVVLTSEHEGCPTIMLEAGAMSRPTLLRNGTEGLKQTLYDACITYDSDADANHIASRIADCYRCREDLEAIGSRARKRFEEIFDERITMAHLRRLYVGDGENDR